jgi:coenzyme F420-0:L-glutamate ligase/coenzyme F420-1:gamma-L-glutamate ligase
MCTDERGGRARRLRNKEDGCDLRRETMDPSLKENLIGLISSRRSIRRFASSAVPHQVIDRALTVATLAPSAHNAQPWRFVVIDKGEKRARLVEEMAQLFQSDLMRDSLPPEEIKKRVSLSKDRVFNAPVLILVCLTMEDMESYTDKRRTEAEYLMAVQSVGAAIQNLLLVAQTEGLGSCWMCAPLFCRDAVKTILSLPIAFDPQAFVIVGVSDEEPVAPRRKPLKDVVMRK